MKNLMRYAVGFYAGAGLMMSILALGFGASIERAIGAGLIWPYHAVSVVAFAFWGVELP